MRPPARRGRSERGSVLALVPAMLLVLILLASIAVDSALVYLKQQQLHDSLAAAANDAATAALDQASFYRGGRTALDPAALVQAVCASVSAQDVGQLHDLAVTVAVSGGSVKVAGAATVQAVFGRLVPGWATRTVRASASARLASGPVAGPGLADVAPQQSGCGL